MTIFAITVVSIWGRGTARIAAVLIGIGIAYVAAAVMTAIGFKNADGSAILTFGETARAWVGLPTFIIAKFDLSAILVVTPISIATMMEHIGDISAISATTKQNFAEDPGLHRTLIGDGLATALAGLLGGPSNTTYGENTGVLVLSGVHDPVVVRVAAVYAIALGLSPRLAGIFGSIPTAVIGGASVVLYGMISAVGIRNLVESRADFSKTRNLLVVAAIMVVGLGSNGVSFDAFDTNVTLTPLALAALTGIVLNAVLPDKDDFSLAGPGIASGSLSVNIPGQEN